METVKEYWEKATPMSFTPENWTYEQKRGFRYELQDYMHNAFRFRDFKGKLVLEIGCGSGIDAIEFARYGAIVKAIDITDNAIGLTEKHAMQAQVSVGLVQASGDNMPYPDNFFDCVYSYGVLHHIENVEDVLKEIQRVLKPDGKVMAMLYHKDSLLYAYSILHLHSDNSLNPEELTCRYSERIEGCPYTKVYTKAEARELFEKYFRNVKISVHYNVIDTPQQRKVNLDICDEYELGWHLVVKAVK